MNLSIGLEFTFVPDLPGTKEYPSERQAIEAAKHLNRLLVPVNPVLFSKYKVLLIAKAERFRRSKKISSKWVGWIVEINNGAFPTLSSHWNDDKFVRLIQRVFKLAKSIGLLPRIRRRGIHHPTGGSHLMLGIQGLFPDNSQFLTELAAFERAWFLDQANRPYIRWLFSEWFDPSHNSEVCIRPEECSHHSSQSAYDRAISTGSIRRRFSDNGKVPYSAYECRFFDMVKNAKQVALQVQFLTAWVRHIDIKNILGIKVKFTLTEQAFNELRDEKHAWRVISSFLDELHLNPADYRVFFDEQYVNRVRYGEML